MVARCRRDRAKNSAGGALDGDVAEGYALAVRLGLSVLTSFRAAGVSARVRVVVARSSLPGVFAEHGSSHSTANRNR